MLFGHGDDIAAHGREIEGNFSSNVWFEDYTKDIAPLVAAAMRSVTSYPEPDAASLRRLLAQEYGVGVDNVLVSNGAIEAIYLAAQAWSRKRSLVVTPTFSEYEDACRLHQHKLSFCTEGEFDGAIAPEVEMVWLCNPNNPTGSIRPRKQILSMVEQHPQVLFVIDQSYGSFSSYELLRHTDVLTHNNLIVICSLTKCFAIPGIRVGYCLSASQNIEQMLRVKIPWSVNTLAIEVAKHFISNRSRYELPLDRWMGLKQQLCSMLAPIEEVEALASQTPYFLMKLHRGTSSELKTYLVSKHGLLIRDAANFRGLDSTYVRIAPQHEAANAKLVKAIQLWTTTK